MVSLAGEIDQTVKATSVSVTDETITVDLENGRTLAVPTACYPRLLHATQNERAAYEIARVGVTWPAIEADFSIRGLLLGRKSGETPASFQFWLTNRQQGRKVAFEHYMKARRKKATKTAK
ncbi:MAG TPA: DUF2442 domain-containing protein [Tepidisphaeraceae bacterium]|nr:DUF2442 domain-containing protein [Tepidisphaeraceae bacterium]